MVAHDPQRRRQVAHACAAKPPDAADTGRNPDDAWDGCFVPMTRGKTEETVPAEPPNVASLITASHRAVKLLAHHADRLDRTATQTLGELAEGHRKIARAEASTLVGELLEVERLVDAALRLTRAAIGTLDEELTRHGEPPRDGDQRLGLGDRRRFDRRSGIGGRRVSDLPPDAE
jgi:hypothetical protein